MLERLGPYALATPLRDEGGRETRHATTVDGAPVRVDALWVGAELDRAARERFTEDAESAAHGQHEGLVRLLDHGVDSGFAYVVYAPFAHKRLRELMLEEPDGRLSPARVALLGADLADAIAYAHGRQPPLVHRGISPDLVCVDGGGRVRLHGYALSALAQAVAPRSGDVAYRSPEIVNERPVTRRADVFSLGSTLYEALTGRAAFDGPTGLATSLKVRMGSYEPIEARAPDAPDELRRLIAKLLAVDPADRPTATSAGNALSALVTDARGHREALGRQCVPPAPVARAPVPKAFETLEELPAMDLAALNPAAQDPAALDLPALDLPALGLDPSESTERQLVPPAEDLDLVSHELDRFDPDAFADVPAEPTMRESAHDVPDTADHELPPFDDGPTDMAIPLPAVMRTGPVTSGPVVLLRKADLEASGEHAPAPVRPAEPPTQRRSSVPWPLLIGGGLVAVVFVLLTAALAAWAAS